MTSQRKKKEVENLRKLMLHYRVISIGDIRSLPSKQFQEIRKRLKEKVFIKVIKKRLIRIAIESLKEKDLKPLNQYLEDSMPVLLLTNEDPFKLYKLLKKSKSKASAKPGQTAPIDLMVSAGPTSFAPGPIIGELGQVGIVASVEAGKVTIKKDTILVKAGETISDKKASILAKLGVEPMEIGLNLKVAYDNGMIYDQSVLDFDEDKLLHNVKLAHGHAIALALKIGYTVKETVRLLINKAALQAGALNSILEPKIEENIKKNKTADINLKKSDYDKDSEKAKEILDRIKDEGEIKKYKEPEYRKSPVHAEDLIKED